MYIIAKDGSGDFTSLQAAIDAVPMSSRMPTILLLRMDEYHEKVIVNQLRLCQGFGRGRKGEGHVPQLHVSGHGE